MVPVYSAIILILLSMSLSCDASPWRSCFMGGLRDPFFSHQLPRELYANLHLASAAAELLRVEEPIGGHIGIGATQGVIDRPKDHPRLKYARLSQREIRMIENIHRINAELKAKPFGYLGIL